MSETLTHLINYKLYCPLDVPDKYQMLFYGFNDVF